MSSETDGPPIFLTDPDGKRYYLEETSEDVSLDFWALLVAILVALAGNRLGFIWLQWGALVVAVIFAGNLFQDWMMLRKLKREQAYRLHDAGEVARMAPDAASIEAQQPHGQADGEGTI